MPQEVHQHTFANGLTLLAECMEDVRSAAFTIWIPAGYAFDPPEHLGLASVLSGWMTRGAGRRDNRQLSEALDNLGLDRSESVGSVHLRLWGATLAKNLSTALEIYADIVRQPHLPEAELEAVQALASQEILSIEDDPGQKAMIELMRRHFPHPLGLDRRGTLAGVASLTPKLVRSQAKLLLQPRDAIIAVAGNIDWSALRAQVEQQFGDWPAGKSPHFQQRAPDGGQAHLDKDTTQTHIALAYPSAPFAHADYYAARGAVTVLSGGMGARLFTEVREKRGLCYAVSASHHSFKECAAILCYAGTTNERAQETLNVTLRELARLQEGVEPDEVERVKVGLKSALIMQEESTTSRAGALASDWYFLSRVRSLEEIQNAINGLTADVIVDYAQRYPPARPTLVTLGPQPLRVGEATLDLPVMIG